MGRVGSSESAKQNDRDDLFDHSVLFLIHCSFFRKLQLIWKIRGGFPHSDRMVLWKTAQDLMTPSHQAGQGSAHVNRKPGPGGLKRNLLNLFKIKRQKTQCDYLKGIWKVITKCAWKRGLCRFLLHCV